MSRRLSHSACRRAALCACAALAATVAGAALDGAAHAADVATMTANLAPNRLGAKASLTITIHVGGGEFGVPAPLQRTVVHFPAGMSLEIPSLRSCSAEQLKNSGARECPAQSKLGEGHALVVARPASETIEESVALSAFLGPPQHLQPTLEVLGEGTTPLAVRMVVAGAVLPDRPPYGEKLVMSIPPIPTVPLEPDASLVDFSLTVGAKRRGKRAANAILVPHRCPAAGFPFVGEFTYADGSSGRAATSIRCPR